MRPLCTYQDKNCVIQELQFWRKGLLDCLSLRMAAYNRISFMIQYWSSHWCRVQQLMSRDSEISSPIPFFSRRISHVFYSGTKTVHTNFEVFFCTRLLLLDDIFTLVTKSRCILLFESLKYMVWYSSYNLKHNSVDFEAIRNSLNRKFEYWYNTSGGNRRVAAIGMAGVKRPVKVAVIGNSPVAGYSYFPI